VSGKAAMKKILGVLEKRFGGLRSLTEDRPLDQLILVLLSRGVPEKKAHEALHSLRDHFVDWNEVRVSPLHEIQVALTPLGPKGMLDKPSRIRALLSLIYSRFNRVDLDFVREWNDRKSARKRDRLLMSIADVSPGLPPILLASLEGLGAAFRNDPDINRVLTRLGWVKTGGTTPAQWRKAVRQELDDGDQLILLWGLHLLAASYCHKSLPDCPHCALKTSCPSADAEMEKARVARQKAKEKARAEARRIAKKMAVEARKKAREMAKREAQERKRREAEEKKREALAKKEADAARKKKEAAKKKAAAAKKKKEAAKKKSAASKKKAAAKKKATAAKKKTTSSKKKGSAATKTTSKKKASKKKASKKKVAKRATAAAKKKASKKKAASTGKKTAKSTKKKATKKPSTTSRKKAAKKSARGASKVKKKSTSSAARRKK